MVAVDSSNSIAIRGDGVTVAKLVAMAQELDKRAAAGTEVRVYWLDHADADKLMPVLQQLLGQGAISGGTTTSSSTPSAAAARGRRRACRLLRPWFLPRRRLVPASRHAARRRDAL